MSTLCTQSGKLWLISFMLYSKYPFQSWNPRKPATPLFSPKTFHQPSPHRYIGSFLAVTLLLTVPFSIPLFKTRSHSKGRTLQECYHITQYIMAHGHVTCRLHYGGFTSKYRLRSGLPFHVKLTMTCLSFAPLLCLILESDLYEGSFHPQRNTVTTSDIQPFVTEAT